MQFGSYLRSMRKENGMTQVELAESVGVDSTYISRLENGRDHPSEEVLLRLAVALHDDPHKMIISAGKVPSEFIKLILHDEVVVQYLKQAVMNKGPEGRFNL